MNQIIEEESLYEGTKEVQAKVIEKNDIKETNPIKQEDLEAKTETRSENKKKNTKLIVYISIAVILLLLILSTIFAIINMNNKTILSGIKINNIDVKGLKKDEAVEKIKNEMQNNSQFIINCEGKDYAILKENLNIDYDFNSAVDEAYSQGRSGNIFSNNFTIVKNMISGKNIIIKTAINKQSLQDEINKINTEIPEGLVESTYYIEENNLIIKKGKAGNGIVLDDIINKLNDSISNNSINKIIASIQNQQPKPIDIEEIRNSIYKEPKNAYFEKDPFTVYPHIEGIDINIEETKKILEEDKEEYIIPLVITKPEITTDQIGTEAFPNLLGRCTTKYDESNVSRSTNLKVATKTINGKVIMPGETFSYNKTLGERTYEKGYRLGHGYVGGRNVDMIGGGICQISSTLYNAVIYANLGIVERHPHAHIAAYLDPGKDATVSYGTLDFKFKNTRKNPIMIKASAKNGIATVEIYGIKEENEYDIQIISYVQNYIGFRTIYEDDPTKDVGYERITQQGMRGCNSTTYKIYKLNGVEVKKELLSKDSFAPMHKYITRGTKDAGTSTQEGNNASVPTNPEPIAQEPEVPSTPSTPTVPDNPTEPETPANPTEPETPSTPPEPVAPENPEP